MVCESSCESQRDEFPFMWLRLQACSKVEKLGVVKSGGAGNVRKLEGFYGWVVVLFTTRGEGCDGS